MSNENALELSSLPVRHPVNGAGLLHEFAPATIVRLSMAPTLRAGILSREIEVNWLRRPGHAPEKQVRRYIGWNDQEELKKVCEQLPYTKNAQDITEAAAIGVAALLIHDLEGAVLQNVLPIGNGGDYLVRVCGEHSFIQLEVSGLRKDETGSDSRSRLRQKTDQVLTSVRVGFVSVTTFCHGPHAVVHSFQHFVRARPRDAASRRPKKKPKGGKGGKK